MPHQPRLTRLARQRHVGRAGPPAKQLSRPGTRVSNMSTVKVHDVKYDTTFKILFGSSNSSDVSRTKNFLNIMLKLEGQDAIESLTFLDGSRHGHGDRSVYFDLSLDCLCVSRNKQRFIVQMQKALVTGHTNR